MAGDALRVRIEWGTDEEGLGAVLRAALDLLDGGGRIRLVGAGQAADIVHTVGAAGANGARGANSANSANSPSGPTGANGAVDGTGHRVHTLASVPLPAWSVPGRWWGRRERRRVGASATWLAHGRVAAQLLVASRAVPGEQVHWLPIVAPLACRADGAVDRVAVRARLGVPPGVVLVVDCAPVGAPDAAPTWERFLATDHRDVMTLRCAAPGSEPGAVRPPASFEPFTSPERLAFPEPSAFQEPPTFPELLAAADLFVARRRALTAANPGVAAVAAGVPVIAVTTDSTAELVRSGRNGFVVPPDPAAVAEAVHAYVAGELPHARVPGLSAAAREPDRVLEELARGLLRAYHCALIHHGGHRSADRGGDRRADRRTERATAAGPDPVPAG